MKVLLFVLSLLSAFVAISAQCDACIEGSCYTRKTVFKSNNYNYGKFAIDRTGNNLYFTFTNSQYEYFSGAYSLDEMKIILISVDKYFSFDRAVDQETRDVYIPGARGLYKYNPDKNSTSFIGLSKDNINSLQFHQKLYYKIFMLKGLYTFENGESKQIPALSEYQIDEFVIDKHNDVYFRSDNIIYRLKNGGKSPSLFADGSYKLATDKNDNVYFFETDENLLYKLSYSNDKLIEVGSIKQGFVFRFMFDRDNNIIYEDIEDNNIYYLTPSYGGCRITSKFSALLVFSNKLDGYDFI